MEKLMKLVEFNRVQEYPILHPCLIAPSGSGKSYTVESLARKFNLPIHVLLLQTMLEYEVIGIPQPAGTVKVVPAEWIKAFDGKEGLVFIDEIDKPREEVISSILSLLASGHINGWDLSKVSFILAGQAPPEMDSLTGEAFRRRMIIIPQSWWYQPDYLSAKHHVCLSWYKDSREVVIEKIYPSNREIDYLIRLWKAGIFTEQEYKELLQWNYDENFINPFMKALKDSGVVNIESIIEELNSIPEKTVDVPIEVLIECYRQCNKVSKEVFAFTTIRLIFEPEEVRKRFLEAVNEGYSKTKEFLTCGEDEFEEFIQRVNREVIRYFMKKYGIKVEELQKKKEISVPLDLNKEDYEKLVDIVRGVINEDIQ